METVGIYAAKWTDIHDFWKENEHLKSDIRPMSLGDTSFRYAPNVFDYAKDKVLVAGINDTTLGCVRIEAKHYGHLRIAALGKMAVHQEFRRNRIAAHLMQAACLYMGQGIFNMSVLWASVLNLYENYGYVAIHKNMMVKYFTQCDAPITTLRQIPSHIGTW